MGELLESLRHRHDRREDFAREWAADGGKVVAYMCDNFPQELVAAAGMLPFRLRGDPSAPTPNVARYVEPDRSAMVTVPAFVDAMLEPLVAGEYEFVDYVVVPHGRKAIETGYESLIRARKAGAPMRPVKLFYLDKSWVHARLGLVRVRPKLSAGAQGPARAVGGRADRRRRAGGSDRAGTTRSRPARAREPAAHRCSRRG